MNKPNDDDKRKAAEAAQHVYALGVGCSVDEYMDSLESLLAQLIADTRADAVKGIRAAVKSGIDALTYGTFADIRQTALAAIDKFAKEGGE